MVVKSAPWSWIATLNVPRVDKSFVEYDREVLMREVPQVHGLGEYGGYGGGEEARGVPGELKKGEGAE